MKSRKKIVFAVLVLLLLAAGAAYYHHAHRAHSDAARELTLFGNVEIRQVALAFNNSERITEVLVEEGDHVKAGQVLARLDTGRLSPLLNQALAQAAAQQQVVEKLRNGSRPEEIAQARSNLEAAEASAAETRQRFERAELLSQTSGVSRQEVDTAAATAKVAEARADMARKSLALLVAGPRAEDIAEAGARLRGFEAQVALLRRQLADTELSSPVDAVVRSRILEPGEIATPQKPVLTLAVTNPKWVRTYVGEPDLGKIHPGAAATVSTDSFPDRRIEGQVGYISSTAEFTPKTLQTEELRSSLVYEVRIVVNDPADDLRLGMPVSVHLPLAAPAASRGN
jgi:HlyD family secretion protein